MIIFSKMSRPALGPTQPPVNLVPWFYPGVVERPGGKVVQSPPSIAEVKNAWSSMCTFFMSL